MLNIGKCVRLKEEKKHSSNNKSHTGCIFAKSFISLNFVIENGDVADDDDVVLYQLDCDEYACLNLWHVFHHNYRMSDGIFRDKWIVRLRERERWCLKESFEIALFVRQTRAMIHMYLWRIEERKEKQPNMCLCVSASAEDEAVKFPCRHRHILPPWMYTMYNVAQAQWTNCSFKRERFICNSPERKQSKISKFWMYNC